MKPAKRLSDLVSKMNSCEMFLGYQKLKNVSFWKAIKLEGIDPVLAKYSYAGSDWPSLKARESRLKFHDPRLARFSPTPFSHDQV